MYLLYKKTIEAKSTNRKFSSTPVSQSQLTQSIELIADDNLVREHHSPLDLVDQILRLNFDTTNPGGCPLGVTTFFFAARPSPPPPPALPPPFSDPPSPQFTKIGFPFFSLPFAREA